MRHISIVAAMLGLWSSSAFALPESQHASKHFCNDCTNESTEPYVLAPAPWELKASVAYVVPIIGLTPNSPDKAFAPLERNSSHASNGQLLASTGLMLIIRYTDSPVGPYDEFIIIPGLYKNPEDGLVPRFKISRIYVSHKYTTWNGRKNWKIPKHQAHFDWTTKSDGTETIKIYPHDTTAVNDESAGTSKLPFFQGTFKLAPLLGNLPGLPSSTQILNVLGGLNLNPLTLASPPLPEGNGVYGELTGTDTWANTEFGLPGGSAKVGTFDLSQGAKGDQIGDTGKNTVGDEYFPNFWPGLPRYNAALSLTDATVSFAAPERY